jgi:hypothetical protein
MGLDIKKLQQTIEAAINENSSSAVTSNVSDAPDGTKTFELRTREATLTATIGKRWIGYDLSVDKSVFGREVGSAVDTDNYPLDGDYTDVSYQIFDELKNCVIGLLQQHIYVGSEDNRPIIATPVSSTEYDVKDFRPHKRWMLFESSETVRMEADQVKSMETLRPLR